VTPYPRRRQVSDPGAAVWRPQVHAAVRAMLVIVRDVLVQDRPQVPRPGDQHPVHTATGHLTECALLVLDRYPDLRGCDV